MSTEPITNETLETLKRLHAAATEGKWEIAPSLTYIRVEGDANDDWIGDMSGTYTHFQQDERNTACVVALHNALPSLIERLERAESELERLNGLDRPGGEE